MAGAKPTNQRKYWSDVAKINSKRVSYNKKSKAKATAKATVKSVKKKKR